MADVINNEAVNPSENINDINNQAEEKKEKIKKIKIKKEKPEKPQKIKNKTKKFKNISYEKKQSFVGFMFTLPWLIGFLMFFFIPAIKSINFSLSDVKIFENYATEWNNFYNYTSILTGGSTYLKNLGATFLDLEINVSVILIFSLFVAVLLNRKFVGRGVARAVFFLPVIVTTGVVMTAFNGASDTSAVFEGDVSNGIMFTTMNATEVLNSLGLSEQITKGMIMVSDRIFDVVWDSGIQIILFLAALQSISPALYEACDVEGATAWERFWLITFPSVSPIILVNIVYTIVDTFSDPSNPVLAQIDSTVKNSFNYGGAAAMVWVYFIIILAIIGLIFLICKRLIFYTVE